MNLENKSPLLCKNETSHLFDKDGNPLEAVAGRSASLISLPERSDSPLKNKLASWNPLHTRLNIEQIISSPPIELSFILPGFKQGSVGALVSPGGVGKSFWTLALSIAISNEKYASVFGIPVASGPVLILSAEDDLDILAHRIKAQAKVFDPLAEGKDLEWEHLHLHSLVGRGLYITDTAFFDQALALSQEIAPKLIIFDTLSRFHCSDENSSREMALVLQRLEALAAASNAGVLFLHHATKSAGRLSQSDMPQSARGSSVLADNSRWVSFLEPMTDRQAQKLNIHPDCKSQYVRWNINKQNYGPAIEDVWFKRNTEGALRAINLEENNESEPEVTLANEAPVDVPQEAPVIKKDTSTYIPSDW